MSNWAARPLGVEDVFCDSTHVDRQTANRLPSAKAVVFLAHTWVLHRRTGSANVPQIVARCPAAFERCVTCMACQAGLLSEYNKRHIVLTPCPTWQNQTGRRQPGHRSRINIAGEKSRLIRKVSKPCKHSQFRSFASPKRTAFVSAPSCPAWRRQRGPRR